MVPRETLAKPDEDQGYKPKVTVEFDDRVGRPSGDLERELRERIYQKLPDAGA